ncbi:FecCD family ABC transporter permease [Xanthobacteraceae bacterium A53D]
MTPIHTNPLLLVPALLALMLLALSWGDSGLNPGDLIAVLKGDMVARTIVGDLRAPRVAVAALVGACLAIAGVITQAVMRNPLAEPGLLGINGGASLAVTLLMVWLSGPVGHLLPLAGFGGASLAAAAIYALSWRSGLSSIRLILMGIGVGALTGAGTAYLTTSGNIRDVQRAVAWMAGSLYGADWTRFGWLVLWAVPAIALARLMTRELDTLGIDDDSARGVGQRIHRARGGLILLCTLLAGASVAAAGPIGFIGLLAPHIARRAAGRRPAGPVAPAALWGAILLVGADLAGRLVQLPAGLLTPLIGVPFIGLLLWKQRHA